MKARGKNMSQQKVDNYKKEKAGRKQALKKKKLMRVVYIAIALVIAAGFGFLIYTANKPVYNVNLSDSKFDEPALASSIGYDGINIENYISGETEEEIAE